MIQYDCKIKRKVKKGVRKMTKNEMAQDLTRLLKLYRGRDLKNEDKVIEAITKRSKKQILDGFKYLGKDPKSICFVVSCLSGFIIK